MQDETIERSLPDYRRPPVIETVLGVQFDRLAGFKNGHLGSFWKSLGDCSGGTANEDWPTVSDAPLLPTQFERFGEAGSWAKGVHLRLTQDPSSRLQIKNAAGDRMIQLQNGRIHFNWLGEAGSQYPRYEDVREGFCWALDRFAGFLTHEKLGEFRPNQWELTYLNHIPKGTVWNTPADWAFFRPLGPVPTIDGLVQGESFDGEWHFVIPEQRGRLHVQWQHAKKKEEIVVLTLTARGPPPESVADLPSIIAGLNLGRNTIVRSFRELMSDAANAYWGLKNAGD